MGAWEVGRGQVRSAVGGGGGRCVFGGGGGGGGEGWAIL